MLIEALHAQSSMFMLYTLRGMFHHAANPIKIPHFPSPFPMHKLGKSRNLIICAQQRVKCTSPTADGHRLYRKNGKSNKSSTEILELIEQLLHLRQLALLPLLMERRFALGKRIRVWQLIRQCGARGTPRLGGVYGEVLEALVQVQSGVVELEVEVIEGVGF